MTLTKTNYHMAKCGVCLYMKMHNGRMECRRFKHSGDYQWPAVRPGDFCGEFTARGGLGADVEVSDKG
jgi:hypothetical protein